MEEKNYINMVWLYPDLFNLHGDRGNIMAFARTAQMLGLELNIKKLENLTDKLELENIDIVISNPGETGTVIQAIEHLKKQKEEILNFIENNNYFITIGTTGAIFSKNITMLDGKKHDGLEILNMECMQRNTVIGDDVYFKIGDDMEIIGSQIQMLDFNVAEECALGKAIYGYGNNGNGLEGGRYKNAIFTNALGPVFVKNIWWTEKILKDIAEKKKYAVSDISNDQKEIEQKSFETSKKFIEKKM